MNPGNERLLKLSAIVSGLAAVITQVLALREFMGIFQGNELVIGLVLGSWMLLTALGSWLGDRITGHSAMTLATLLVLLAFFMVFSVWGAVFLRARMFPEGIMLDASAILVLTMIALGPYCIVSGMVFPLLARIMSDNDGRDMTNMAYALESAGSIAGGLLFSLVLVLLLNTTQIVSLLALMVLLTAASVCMEAGNKWTTAIVALAAVGWVAVLFLSDPEAIATRLLLNNQEIIVCRDTPYGKLVISNQDGQMNIYENGIPVYSGENIPDREESVHYSLLQVRQPGRVLMMSGGLGGAIDEALKYPGISITYVESDPWLARKALRDLLLPGDDSVRYIYGDGRRYIRKTCETFDAIMVNLPPPLSAGVNRYYTLEFFRESSGKLNPGGVFCISLPGGNQYLGEESRRLHSSLMSTLGEVFPYLRLVPGHRHYFLASDHPVDKHYQSLIAAMPELGNEYVNEHYLRDDLMDMRTDAIVSSLDANAPVNKDLRPYSYSLYVQYWLSHFKAFNSLLPWMLIAITVLFIVLLPLVRLGLFMSGLSAATYEFMLMVVLQVVLGNIYWLAGLVFAAFMAGMASGSGFRDKIARRSNSKSFITIQAIIAGLLLATALSIPSAMALGETLLIVLIFFLVFIAGALTGLQFAIAVVFAGGPARAGKNYAADLAGSAIGIWLFTVFVLPRAGIINTCLILSAMNLIVAAVIRMRIKIA